MCSLTSVPYILHKSVTFLFQHQGLLEGLKQNLTSLQLLSKANFVRNESDAEH